MSAALKISSPATHEYWEIPVLFEDEQLLALDKPAGLLTSPDRYDPARPNLMRLLHTAIAEGKPWTKDRRLTYLANVHRLDFETSGVLLLAKSKPTLVALANLFGTERPMKHYTALVRGVPTEAKFEVDTPLAPHPVRPGLMRVDSRGGKKSRTAFEVIESFDGYALVRCRPFTNRPHQIRVHLRHRRLAVLGDGLYGGGTLLLSQLKRSYRLKPGHEERPLLDRAALHAEHLAFTHPLSGQAVDISAPLPKHFNVALKYLRRFAPAPQRTGLDLLPRPVDVLPEEPPDPPDQPGTAPPHQDLQ